MSRKGQNVVQTDVHILVGLWSPLAGGMKQLGLWSSVTIKGEAEVEAWPRPRALTRRPARLVSFPHPRPLPDRRPKLS